MIGDGNAAPENRGSWEIRLPHEFERDVRFVVVLNHEFAMERIAISEAEELAKNGDVENIDDDDAGEYARSINNFIREGWDEIRKGAHALAIVGVVTRLHHWVIKCANTRRTPPCFRHGLVREIQFLTGKFGNPPVPLDYFEKLVTVRDSIIHADSKAEWEHKEDIKRVDEKYTRSGVLQLTQEHLDEAIQNACQIAKWCDRK